MSESQPSVIPSPRPAAVGRKVADVPFVELFGRRVQGVVSSGSDIDRVYCSFYEGVTGNYYCSTNNNRRCGGLGGSPCKHIGWMMDEAIKAFGADAIATTLQIDPGLAKGSRSAMGAVRGAETKEPAGVVFSRFLGDLRFVELPGSNLPLPELGWFLTG